MKCILPILILLLPVTTFAHAGRLNSEGCHNNSKTGQYECHEKKTKDTKKSKSKVSAKSKATTKVSTKSDYNCSDFSSRAEAQKVFLKAGGPKNDIYRLDRDKDGIACENLK